MARTYRSPIFRNGPAEVIAPAIVPNPKRSRPISLALDIVEIDRQVGSVMGVTRIDHTAWASIFYRGEDARASSEATRAGWRRWRKLVREAGLSYRDEDDPDDPVLCIDMVRALPWAESVLEESERRVADRKRTLRARRSCVARKNV